MKSPNEYGPPTEQVKALLKQINRLSPEQTVELASVWNRVWASGTRKQAFDAVWEVITADETRRSMRNATRHKLPASVTSPACKDALDALIARDLIGDIFTQTDYDMLTGPWRKIIGSIHPDDQAILETGEKK